MRGHELGRFWTHLRWMTQCATPELPAFWREVTAVTGFWGMIPIVAALIATSATSNPVWLEGSHVAESSWGN